MVLEHVEDCESFYEPQNYEILWDAQDFKEGTVSKRLIYYKGVGKSYI